MGLIDFIKNKIVLARQNKEMARSFKKAMKELETESNKYILMSIKELSLLPDDKIFKAAVARTQNKVDAHVVIVDGINELNETQKVFYSINWFEIEVQNGGLCQFFINSSRAVAPLISKYLEIIRAEEHKRLYDEFISLNQINLNDLSFFNLMHISEYEEKTKLYPFENFDTAYYNLVPLENYLTSYVKHHIVEF